MRVRWYPSGIGQDGVSPAYYERKYSTRSANTVLADDIKARLIIAENQLKTGGDWLTDVNFPVTIDEQNNANAQRCTDRNP